MSYKQRILKRKGSLVLPFLLLCLGWKPLLAQTNLSGKPGLIYIPSAAETKDGEFRIGYNYNPKNYGLRHQGGGKSEQIWYVNLAILRRLEVNLNLLQGIDRNGHKIKDGLGDRQLDLRYLLFRETARRPSIAIIMSSPFTIDAALMTHALVATKRIDLSAGWGMEVSLGVGSPYYFYRNVNNLQNSNILKGYKWQKKSNDRYDNNYLVGPFGGVVLHYRKKLGLMAEYDGNHINVGAYGLLFKRWTIQAGLLNGDGFTAGTSYAFALMKPSKPLRNKK